MRAWARHIWNFAISIIHVFPTISLLATSAFSSITLCQFDNVLRWCVVCVHHLMYQVSFLHKQVVIIDILQNMIAIPLRLAQCIKHILYMKKVWKKSWLDLKQHKQHTQWLFILPHVAYVTYATPNTLNSICSLLKPLQTAPRVPGPQWPDCSGPDWLAHSGAASGYCPLLI